MGTWGNKDWVVYNPKISRFNVREALILQVKLFHPAANRTGMGWFRRIQRRLSVSFSIEVLRIPNCAPERMSNKFAYILKTRRRENHNFIPHRIHGAAIYGVPWIPSIYPLYVSINIPAPWIRHGYM